MDMQKQWRAVRNKCVWNLYFVNISEEYLALWKPFITNKCKQSSLHA